MSVPAKMNSCISECAQEFYNPDCNDDGGFRWVRLVWASQKRDVRPPYHRRPTACGCIRPGDTEGGGLDMVMPVAGLMMGMALRARVAEGWWSFKVDCGWL